MAKGELGLQTFDMFLITTSWRDEMQNHQLVFWAHSPQLGAVELVFQNTSPVFFVDHEEKLPAFDFPIDRKPLKLQNFLGRQVDGLYFKTQRDHRQGWERCRATGVRHFEADIRPDERFLMERFIRGGIRVMGTAETQEGFTRFVDPKIKAQKVVPEFSVVSLDIETGVKSGELYSIGVHFCGRGQELKKVFMLADRREDLPDQLALYPSETALLEAFLEWFIETDPDLIIGWHVIGFDLMFLERKCSELGLFLDLARGGEEISLVEKPGAGYFATIPGRIVIDGPPVMRAAGFTFPNYKLETVAQEILDTGKLIASDQNKIAEIERQFREDKASLARYNLEDCVLVSQIFEKAGILPFLIARVETSGLLMDELGLPHAAFDRYYLPKLHRMGLVAPTAEESAKKATKTKNGLEPKPGIFESVVHLTLGSLLPSMVCSFNIDPLSLLRCDVDPAVTPSGQSFSKSETILPHYLLELIDGLQKAQAAGDPPASRAFEMILENLCTVLRSKNSRFYRDELDEALSVCADWLLKESRNFLESLGHEVVYGDVDTMLIRLSLRENADLEDTARKLADDLGHHCRRKMKAEFGIDPTLSFDFRQCFTKLMLPEAKTQAEAAKKRFGGLVLAGGKQKLLFEGMSLTGSDWTPLAQDFQRALLHNYFTGENVETFIRTFVADLREGVYDDQLAYRKKLKKDLDSYARNPPPQVRAARLLSKPGKYIDYVFCKRGPVPTSMIQNDLDYEHYVEKQLQPVADTLLQLLGRSFRSMADHKQFELF